MRPTKKELVDRAMSAGMPGPVARALTMDQLRRFLERAGRPGEEPGPGPAPHEPGGLPPLPAPAPGRALCPPLMLPAGLRYLEPDPYFIDPFPGFTRRLHLKSLWGPPRNVLLMGPTGSGKTSWARNFAAVHRRPYAEVNLGDIAEPEQLLGHWEARDGSTEWVPSVLAAAVRVEGAVILLDELNRGFSSKVTNALMPALDARRELGGQRVADHVVFIATLNEGLDYTGTDQLDAAVRDRFAEGLTFSYPGPDTEANLLTERTGLPAPYARAAAQIAANLRGKYVVSPRALVAFAEDLLAGAPPIEALERTLGLAVPGAALRNAVAAVEPGWL